MRQVLTWCFLGACGRIHAPPLFTGEFQNAWMNRFDALQRAQIDSPWRETLAPVSNSEDIPRRHYVTPTRWNVFVDNFERTLCQGTFVRAFQAKCREDVKAASLKCLEDCREQFAMDEDLCAPKDRLVCYEVCMDSALFGDDCSRQARETFWNYVLNNTDADHAGDVFWEEKQEHQEHKEQVARQNDEYFHRFWSVICEHEKASVCPETSTSFECHNKTHGAYRFPLKNALNDTVALLRPLITTKDDCQRACAEHFDCKAFDFRANTTADGLNLPQCQLWENVEKTTDAERVWCVRMGDNTTSDGAKTFLVMTKSGRQHQATVGRFSHGAPRLHASAINFINALKASFPLFFVAREPLGIRKV